MESSLDEPTRNFLTDQLVGTLTTLRPDGKARSTVVYFALATPATAPAGPS